ncbi:FAD/NAD(P)-binding protein [Aeromicrobium sp. YIM 150415]|uniref:FAD/NAD(P)-binding protein n=1 Tax=Aeromicrobium sp. YIM 150415 TaxID=2803912 RepID=UPI0019658DC7|nr:FAD/NAD(P)-binding protein [Aeromicrobium sp. YIM 150415]MBM9463714.1 FAD/NAD(P)-binding protein [Aeromicrobium sp. YIM 150415]
MSDPARPFRVVVVGAGPRGIATAHAVLSEPRPETLEVVMVDPHPGGRVWRRDQDRHLLMNSRLSQATLFVDDSVAGSLRPEGPTFAEWCADIAPELDLRPEARRELAGLGPADFASRALFGEYTRWAVEWLQERGLQVIRDQVMAVRPSDRGHEVVLGEGGILHADAVVLAIGHVDGEPSGREVEWSDFARRTGLLHIPPGPASEADLNALPPGADVAVLGAGLNFYDVVARTILGRGGRFERLPDGTLRYRPSGAEPLLWVGSGRGVPYMARGLEPSSQELAFLTSRRQQQLIDQGAVDIGRDVWPDIVREMRHAWHFADARRRGVTFDSTAVACSLAALPHEGSEVDAWCAEHLGGRPMELDRILDPLLDLPDAAVAREVMRRTLREYVDAARSCPSGPITAIGERLALAKNAVRDLVAVGAISPASLTGDLQGWFRSVGGFVAAGPPLERVEQVLALVEADIVKVAGRRARVRTDDERGVFLLSSDTLTDQEVTAVVEARLHADDLRSTTSVLVHQLLSERVGRLAVLEDSGGLVPTGGLDVTRGADRPCRVLDGTATPWPNLFALGISVQPLEWNIANLPLPGTGARTLVQARAIATQIHHLADAAVSATVP